MRVSLSWGTRRRESLTSRQYLNSGKIDTRIEMYVLMSHPKSKDSIWVYPSTRCCCKNLRIKERWIWCEATVSITYAVFPYMPHRPVVEWIPWLSFWAKCQHDTPKLMTGTWLLTQRTTSLTVGPRTINGIIQNSTILTQLFLNCKLLDIITLKFDRILRVSNVSFSRIHESAYNAVVSTGDNGWKK